MNEWKESNWFKTWLALARAGQNEMNRPDPPAADLPFHDRQISHGAMNLEQVPASEWEVTE